MTVRADATLDCVGLLCPVPIYLTAQRLMALTSGAVLQVVNDDPAIVEDLPAWCRKTSHELLGQEQQGPVYRFWVRKAQETSPASPSG
ncbi:MAG: sulfurtransferase TusA family protein [Candidatus Omnitrophica bacterium]|nr:sulfurtransferase TusA family protein [Candidatus Omnitrophota bacterium]